MRATLLVDRSQVGPGDTLRVGVLLAVDPGWHVYWQNPGDAGLATEVTLTLPAGWAAGEVEWPLPTAFAQPGGMVGYGYEGTVLLAREVRVAAGWRPSAALRLRVQASWLACREICVLGKARLEGDLVAGTLRVDPAAFARRLLPMSAVVVGASVLTTRGAAPGELTVWVSWPVPPGEVEWFPEPATGLEVKVRRVATRAGLTRVDLVTRRVGADPPASRLQGVAVVRDPAGRRGYLLETNLD